MRTREPVANRRLSDEQRRTLSRLIAAASRRGASASDVQALSDYTLGSLHHVPYYAPGADAYLIFRGGALDLRSIAAAIRDLNDLVNTDDWGEQPTTTKHSYRPLDLDEFDDEQNGNGHHE